LVERRNLLSKSDVFQRIRTYCKSNYKQLDINDFILGDAPFNRRCHINSVQKVKEGKATKVLLCFTIDKENNSQYVHFINQLENGKYQDNTWGWIYESTEYYFIKEVNKEEQQKVWNVLQDTKKSLLYLHSNWLERFLFRIKVEDL
jgi:hypothetical protein